MSLVLHKERFASSGSYSSEQYFSIYKNRIDQLKPLIIPSLPPPVFDHINEVKAGIQASFVGVIFKELTSRPNILKEYMEIDVDSHTQTEISTSAEDILYLEDITGRIRIDGVPPASIPTGVVVGVNGSIQSGKVIVNQLFFPSFSPSKPIPLATEPKVIALVSNLSIDSNQISQASLKALAATLHSIPLAVFLGNNFEEADTLKTEDHLSFSARLDAISLLPLTKLDSFLKFANPSASVIIPGKSDPVSLRLPQQPYHSILIKTPSVELATNPAEFEYDGIQFLCMSGEPVLDIKKTTSLSFHEAQKSLLQWGHVAPTAPDQLPCIPFTNKDLLVLECLPHIFACGGAEAMEVSKVLENTMAISVPDFKKTKSIVLLDLQSGEATQKCFADSQQQ